MDGKKGQLNLKKSLNNYDHIGLDTNIFIYYFDNHSKFHALAEDIFIQSVKKRKRTSCSILTLSELLSIKANPVKIKILEDNFSQIPNLTIFDVDHKIAKLAAKIRREYNFLLPDAIQLATATLAKVNVFITNDVKLQKFKELRVVLLTDIIQ